jgi:hypothetical protein
MIPSDEPCDCEQGKNSYALHKFHQNLLKILLTTIKGVFKRMINDPIAQAKINENRF